MQNMSLYHIDLYQSTATYFFPSQTMAENSTMPPERTQGFNSRESFNSLRDALGDILPLFRPKPEKVIFKIYRLLLPHKLGPSSPAEE